MLLGFVLLSITSQSVLTYTCRQVVENVIDRIEAFVPVSIVHVIYLGPVVPTPIERLAGPRIGATRPV